MSANVLIVAHSVFHGNTLRMGYIMAKTLNCAIATPSDLQGYDISQYDVIGLGSGVYYTDPHPDLVSIAERIVPPQQVFLFASCGNPWFGDKSRIDYHRKLRKLFTERQVEVVGECLLQGHACLFVPNASGAADMDIAVLEAESKAFIEELIEQGVFNAS